MDRPKSLNQVVLDYLMSKSTVDISVSLDQAQDLDWDLPQVLLVLGEFLEPLLAEGYFEDWPELDSPSVPGPRLETEGGSIPLVSILERWPNVVPYLPWLPGRRPQFSLYEYVELSHNLSPEELDALERRGPVWELILRADGWKEASTAFAGAEGAIEERYLQFDSYFEEYPYLGEPLRAQTAEAGVFLLGKQVEFEGNHNDAEFRVLVVRLVDPPAM